MKATTKALTGTDVAAARRQAGLTQAALGARLGLARHAVSHWERRAQVDLGAETPRRLFRALVGLGVLPLRSALPHRQTTDARARGEVSARRVDDAWVEARMEAERLRLARRRAERKAEACSGHSGCGCWTLRSHDEPGQG